MSVFITTSHASLLMTDQSHTVKVCFVLFCFSTKTPAARTEAVQLTRGIPTLKGTDKQCTLLLFLRNLYTIYVTGISNHIVSNIITYHLETHHIFALIKSFRSRNTCLVSARRNLHTKQKKLIRTFSLKNTVWEIAFHEQSLDEKHYTRSSRELQKKTKSI